MTIHDSFFAYEVLMLEQRWINSWANSADICFSCTVLHFRFLLRVEIPCSFQDRLMDVKVFTKMRKKMSKLQVSISLNRERFSAN